jgi:hypothetical protein
VDEMMREWWNEIGLRCEAAINSFYNIKPYDNNKMEIILKKLLDIKNGWGTNYKKKLIHFEVVEGFDETNFNDIKNINFCIIPSTTNYEDFIIN